METEITKEVLLKIGFKPSKELALYTAPTPQFFLGNPKGVGISVSFIDQEVEAHLTEWNSGDHPDYNFIKAAYCRTIDDLNQLIRLVLP